MYSFVKKEKKIWFLIIEQLSKRFVLIETMPRDQIIYMNKWLFYSETDYAQFESIYEVTALVSS